MNYWSHTSDTVDEAQAKKMLKLFLTQMDRTILDSFSHANIGPRETKAGRLLLEAEKELENAVPNLSFKYDEDITPDDFALKAIDLCNAQRKTKLCQSQDVQERSLVRIM